MTPHARLQTPPVLARRLAEMLGAVATEVTQRGEVHAVGDLCERKPFVIEVFLQDGHRVAVDKAADTVAGDTLDGGGEVLRRHVQSLGIVAHLALGAADAGGEQVGQLSDDIGGAVAVGVGGLALRVRLEDVVHHRQAEAAHQLTVEQQVAVVHAVTETVEVCEENVRLPVGELDDRVVVERDAAPDAVVVRRQQSAEVLVVGGEPLDLHPRCRREVLRPRGVRHHHQVVFHDVVTFLVEHETSLPRRAEQVHAGVAQLGRVHREEIGGIEEVRFHSAKVHFFLQFVKTLILFVKLSRWETLYFCLVKLAKTIRIL